MAVHSISQDPAESAWTALDAAFSRFFCHIVAYQFAQADQELELIRELRGRLRL